VDERMFGRRGPRLPVVGMGTRKTLDVSDPAQVEARKRLVNEALTAGTRIFDSSPMYGAAERVLGQALEGRRKEAFVATKVWARSASEIESQISASLECFGGHIDLYQVHNLMHTEEVLHRLKELRSTGQVSMIGVTHHDPRALPELARWMEKGDIDAVQLLYNASRVEVEERVLPLAAELGIGVLIMEPLGAGMLVAEEPPAGLMDRLRAKGVRTWAQSLPKWVLSDPRVHAVLPATRRAGRPSENAVAGAPPWLDAEERDAIRAVFDR
jgi:aryl-alcohol dehydrogenase-like predicted oxidoreductase